jgi:hypothetical protein
MRKELLYVEMIQGHSGPAWIGYGQFTKSNRTVYFNGKVFGRSQGIIGNHVDIEEGDEYWISGVKKNGHDRHWAGGGKINIDKEVIDDYLKIIGQSVLPKNKFILVKLNNIPNKDLSVQLENFKADSEKIDKIRLYKKSPIDLSDEELGLSIKYYSELDMTTFPMKSRKGYLTQLNELIMENKRRNENS